MNEKEEDLIFDLTEDLEEIKAALMTGLEELQSFIEGKEKTTTDGKHKNFEGQGSDC